MNTNRILGIFIAVTLLTWILIFALSPQPKYQQTTNINIPKLPEPLVDDNSLKKIEFYASIIVFTEERSQLFLLAITKRLQKVLVQKQTALTILILETIRV